VEFEKLGRAEGHNLAEPRKFDTNKSNPDEMNEQGLLDFLQRKNVVFLTGAGISRESVPDQERLNSELGIDNNQAVDDFTRLILNDPNAAAEKIKERFIYQMAVGKPSPAHHAIKEMSRALQCPVFTDNIDLLHQRSGINPINTSNPQTLDWLRKNVTEDHFRDVDAIVTVGYSHDDVGLLASYKKANPDGKIIAINPAKPEYLGDEDFLVQGKAKGDAQKMLPELAEELRFLQSGKQAVLSNGSGD